MENNNIYDVNLLVEHSEYLAIMDFVNDYTDISVVEQAIKGLDDSKIEQALVEFYIDEFLHEAIRILMCRHRSSRHR